MRIITLNVNGIRSAVKKGLWTWLESAKADVVCLQETKACCDLLPADFFPAEYHTYWHNAQKPGYSGVAILSRQKPEQVKVGLGWDLADDEGRYVQVDFANVSVASLYLPSGSSGETRQAAKFSFMERYKPILHAQNNSKRHHILCGDWNIVHREIDIKNWKSNQKNSGCLPEERAWLDSLFTELGWVDAFRVVNQQAEQYSWWSNRGQAWAKNVGWRIDYQIISSGLAQHVKQASIYKEQRFSDHAPVIIDYSPI